ncbi:MAG: isoprenyl transferase [Candidatus Omnitrophota bacterium]
MLNENNIPKHIAIIMDGNGRWAKQRGFTRTEGHRQGMKAAREIIKAADQLGIKVLTLFTFSTENWDRPKKEVEMLMRALRNYLKSERGTLKKNNIRFNSIGQLKKLPDNLQKDIQNTIEFTKKETGMVLNLALNYGGRLEIVEAAKTIANLARTNRLDPEMLDEDVFSGFLYTKDLPDPDLLIRTSGEKRISNFLLWQLSYAELIFVDKYWPDFKKADLEEAIFEFQRRKRRFGRV